MELGKLQFFKSFRKRFGKSVKDCFLTIKSLELKARRCYDKEPTNLTPPKFIEMLVLDGCFIIEFVLQMGNSGKAENYLAPCIKTSIVRDLLLFENQIPYCVINELYKLVPEQGDLAVILLDFFEKNLAGMGVHKGNIGSSNDGIKHLLELIYINLIPTQKEEVQSLPEKKMDVCIEVSSSCKKIPIFTKAFENICPWKSILHWCSIHIFHNSSSDVNSRTTSPPNPNSPKPPLNPNSSKPKYIIRSATSLKEYNVKFENTNSADKFEISFDNGTMRLPFVHIQDETESVVRNLIAYEQYFRDGEKCYVRDVTLLFDSLINSAEDVKLLVKCGIIGELLGSEKVTADMFNKLNEHVRSYGTFSYKDVFEKVEKHCKQRWHAWMAKLKQNHLNSPWALLSMGAALVLLILTFLQTLFTIIK